MSSREGSGLEIPSKSSKTEFHDPFIFISNLSLKTECLRRTHLKSISTAGLPITILSLRFRYWNAPPDLSGQNSNHPWKPSHHLQGFLATQPAFGFCIEPQGDRTGRHRFGDGAEHPANARGPFWSADVRRGAELPQHPAGRFGHILEHGEAKILLTDTEFAPVIREARSDWRFPERICW